MTDERERVLVIYAAVERFDQNIAILYMCV